MDVIHELLDTLKTHFEQAIPTALQRTGLSAPGDIASIFAGFPDPRQELVYPSISIDAPTPGVFAGHYPRQHKLTQPVSGTDPILTALWSVATVEVPLQIDIWASHPFEREAVADAVRTVLRSTVPDQGHLRLTMTNYFSVLAAYRLAGTGSYQDTPGQVQTEEWRATLIVDAECKEVLEATNPRFIDLTTKTTVLPPADPPYTIVPESRQLF